MTRGDPIVSMLRRAYAGWMAFAKKINRVVTALLFGAVYCLVVPLFAILARTKDSYAMCVLGQVDELEVV